ncbi:MAG: glycosyltransferase [Myxococcota bacterium]
MNEASERIKAVTQAFAEKADRITPLAPLPRPIYFVSSDVANWPELRSGLPDDLEPSFRKCSEGVHIWAVQSVIYLRQRGLDVRLSRKLINDEICVVPYHDLFARHLPFRSFVVACRLDSARPAICEMQTVLSQSCVVDPNQDFFMPQWVNPVIKRRDPARGGQAKVLSFKGTLNNLAWPFRRSDFAERLQAHGLRFESSPDLPKAQLIEDWCDHRNVDLILAVRNLTEADYKVKPPVKLLNSWSAGVPALLGPEPSYRDLYRDDLDFVEVQTPEDVVQACIALARDPARYVAMVERGYQRAEAFTPDAIATAWHTFLGGPVMERFERWRRGTTPARLALGSARFGLRLLQHRRNLKTYLVERDRGSRFFGEEPKAG